MGLRFRREVGEKYYILDADGNVVSTHTIKGCRVGKHGKMRIELEVDAPASGVDFRTPRLDNTTDASQS